MYPVRVVYHSEEAALFGWVGMPWPSAKSNVFYSSVSRGKLVSYLAADCGVTIQTLRDQSGKKNAMELETPNQGTSFVCLEVKKTYFQW